MNRALLFSTTILPPFFLGYLFFSHWLFRDVQIRWGASFLSQLYFSATLAVSFQMHILLFLHMCNLTRPKLLNDIWRLDLYAFILLLRFLGPLIFLYALNKSHRRPLWVRLATTLVMYLAYLLLNFKAASRSVSGQIETLGFIGVALMALLSGWGAVAGPYHYGPWFRRAYSDAEIAAASSRLQGLLDLVAERKRQALVAKPSKNAADRTATLEALAHELFLERVEMKAAKSSILFSRTPLGRVYTLAGYLFAVYCVLRVIAALWTLCFPRGPHDADIVTRSIAVLFVSGSEETRRILAQSVSIVLVGCMVFNSFRGLLLTLGKMFHAVGVVDTTLVSLLLAQMLGHYMMSSIILLNLGLPLEYRFSDFVQFTHFRRWFELLFLLAATASLLLLAVQHKNKQSRTEFYEAASSGADKLL